MEDINLHFTGDIHAIELAHNLLAALLDNHVHHGNELGIDPRRIVWSRVMDMNDRALRQIIIGLGGINNAMPRETGFDITVASRGDGHLLPLRVAGRAAGAAGADHRRPTPATSKPVTAADLKAHGAMTVLLKDALQAEPGADAGEQPGLHPRRAVRQHRPRLQQRDRHQAGPAAGRVHGHRGRLRRRPGGREVHRTSSAARPGIRPDAVVIVATVRALKYHGGVALKDLGKPNLEALDKGIENLKKHIENIHRFGLPVVVAINSFTSDTDEEIKFIRTSART